MEVHMSGWEMCAVSWAGLLVFLMVLGAAGW